MLFQGLVANTGSVGAAALQLCILLLVQISVLSHLVLYAVLLKAWQWI
jgi:hypothetical protein